MMPDVRKVALVVGASRGIGRQVAVDLAKAGYAIVVSAKTTSDAAKCVPFPPDPNSPQSTINTVAREIDEAGGRALAISVDVRSDESVRNLIQTALEAFKRIDVVVYNSGAIWWSSVAKTPFARFQLMQAVNPGGLYSTIQAVLPLFHAQGTGRIVVVSPPIYSRFFRGKTAYAAGKVAMSVLAAGLAMDWEREGRGGLAITSIWPASAIESAATEHFFADRGKENLRSAKIFSDAILAMLDSPPAVVNGLLATDEDFLRDFKGVTDFSVYSLVPGTTPRRIMPKIFPDLRVAEHDDEGDRVDSVALRQAQPVRAKM